MHIYIVTIIISLVLISILFFALRSTVKRIDYNTKKYFIEKLQDYDYLIEEKKEILKGLNEEIENKKNIMEKEQKNNNTAVISEKQEYYGDLRTPEYMDRDLLKKYKNIKSKFSFNKELLIKKFIKNIDVETNSDYELLETIRDKFTKKRIYEIMKLRKKEQKSYINKLLNNEEFNLIEKIIDLENIKINNFIIQLNTLIEKNDPIVYVYTSEKNKNYDYISPLIETRYDKNINEGIKIHYKGVLYDYSL